jgi:hypothetical protein
MKRFGLWFLMVMSLCGGIAQAAPLPVAGVTASANGTAAPNAVDGDFSTRWSASGDAQWIQFELTAPATVSDLQIDWYQGQARVYTFDVETSEDGTTWTPAFSGTSDGVSVQYETVDIPDILARFVRIVGFGNTVNDFTSIVEVIINGTPAETVPPTVEVPLSALEAICAPLLPPAQ